MAIQIKGNQVADETITGDKILDGSITDDDINDVDESKITYNRLIRSLSIGASAMSAAPAWPPTYSELSVDFGAWFLPDSSLTAVDAHFVIPEDFENGTETDTILQIFYTIDTDPQETKYWRYGMYIGRQIVSSSLRSGTPSGNTLTVNVGDVGILKKYEASVDWEDEEFVAGDLVFCRVFRAGDYAGDTYTDNVCILGVNFKYPSNLRGTTPP